MNSSTSLPREKKRAPKVLAIVPSMIASCQINVIKPLLAMSRRGQIEFRYYVETNAGLNDIHWADIVIFARNTEPAYRHLLNEAVATGKPIIYDIDDNFWEVPFETDPETARYHRMPLRIEQLEQYLCRSNLVRVYSPVMEEIIRRHNSNVERLKAGFDFSFLPKQSPQRGQGKTGNGGVSKVRIVYATSRTIDDQYVHFADAILRVLPRYPNVELTIWGCQPRELMGRSDIQILPLIKDYDSFQRAFVRQGFDIGLAPLTDTPFHRCKTNTKFRDYGAAKIAGIYSNVDVYSCCVENRVTGLIVNNNADDWYRAVCELVENETLRRQIQDNAFAEVMKEYSQECAEADWMREISDLLLRNEGYSLSYSDYRKVSQVLIRSDFEGLSGVRFPAASPGDCHPVGKVFLQVLTVSGNLLRDAATMQFNRRGDDEIEFRFDPIVNSRAQELMLRFTSLPENTRAATAERWLPTSAFIEMMYSVEHK